MSFNPQRLVGAAATRRPYRWGHRVAGFNPQRLVGAAATRRPYRWGHRVAGFNPQRLVGAAATTGTGTADGARTLFQSSAARRSRCNNRAEFFEEFGEVSILSGSSEPLQLRRKCDFVGHI